MRKMQDIWEENDQRFRDKFQGKMGLTAFQEVMPYVYMGITHEVLKLGIDQRHHAELDRHWWGSLLPQHPLHPLRTAVHNKQHEWTIAASSQFSQTLQAKFQWVDDNLYPWVAGVIDRRAADVDRFVDYVRGRRR